MKIIISDKENLIIVNKSKFIGFVKKVMNNDEALEYLNQIRKQYSDATHVCYAYILPNQEKYSDDNEPVGTAGIPILDLLKKNNLSYVIAIVVRYFGGIKLGSNGLIRAYTSTIKELLTDNVKDIETGYLIEINDDYTKSSLIDYLLKDEIIISKEYQDKITIKAIVHKKTLDNLSNVNYKIISEQFI